MSKRARILDGRDLAATGAEAGVDPAKNWRVHSGCEARAASPEGALEDDSVSRHADLIRAQIEQLFGAEGMEIVESEAVALRAKVAPLLDPAGAERSRRSE